MTFLFEREPALLIRRDLHILTYNANICHIFRREKLSRASGTHLAIASIQAMRRRGTFAAISNSAARDTASRISESADAGR